MVDITERGRLAVSLITGQDLSGKGSGTASVGVLLLLLGGETAAQPMWRGVVVAPESRCAPYNVEDYRYPLSVEAQIVAALGGVYSPYTGHWFNSARDGH